MIFLYTNEGRITGSTENSIEKVQPSADVDNLNLYEAAIDDQLSYISIELLYIDIRDNKLKQKPPQPSPAHYFDYKQRVWQVELDKLQEYKWEDLKREVTVEEEAGFEHDGDMYDSDKESQVRINSAAVAAGIDPSATFNWTLKNNTVKPLNAGQMRQVTKSMNEHIQGWRNRRTELREECFSLRREKDIMELKP